MDPVTAPATLQPPNRASTPRRAGSADVADTARDFEAIFLGEMTKLMLESTQADGPFTGGHGEEMFRGILAEEMGKSIAAHGGIGLAPTVQAQIIRMQEGSADGH